MAEKDELELSGWFPFFCKLVREEAGGELLSDEEVRLRARYLTEVHNKMRAVIIARHAKERPDDFDYTVPEYAILLFNKKVKGLQPKRGDIVRERLKVNFNGKVLITHSSYVDEIVCSCVEIYEDQISSETTAEILFHVSEAMSSYQPAIIPTARQKLPGPGEWIVYLHDAYGSRMKFQGYRGHDFDFEGTSLSDFIRKKLNRDDLFLFS